jgi:hypothetical protein
MRSICPHEVKTENDCLLDLNMTLLAAMTASLNLLLRAGDSRNVLMRKLLIRKCAHGKMRLPEKVITERSLVADPTGGLVLRTRADCILVGSMC